jgi:siroheme synthase
MAATVYLVGAGPGNPDLLTLKAVRVLQQADVVYYEESASGVALAVVPSGIACQCLPAEFDRSWFRTHVVAPACAGRRVVVLKTGDPLVFTTAAEEIEELRAAGVQFEVVPGVTAAQAAAAAAGVPLTDRRWVTHLLWTTASAAEGGRPEELVTGAAAETTWIVYSPGEEYLDWAAELLAAGLDEDTPVTVVHAATLPSQRILRSTLGSLPALGSLPEPALVLIGGVAAYAEPSRETSTARVAVDRAAVADVGSCRQPR